LPTLISKVDIVMTLEDEFDIEISDEDADAISCVQDVIDRKI